MSPWIHILYTPLGFETFQVLKTYEKGTYLLIWSFKTFQSFLLSLNLNLLKFHIDQKLRRSRTEEGAVVHRCKPAAACRRNKKGKAISSPISFMMIKEDDDEANLYITRRLGTLGALNYCWRPFGPSELAILYSDFVPSACVIYAMVTATKFSFLYFSVFAFWIFAFL